MDPQWRRCGYAGQILDAMIEYSYKNGIGRLWLHSSEKGKPLYLKKDFPKRRTRWNGFRQDAEGVGAGTSVWFFGKNFVRSLQF